MQSTIQSGNNHELKPVLNPFHALSMQTTPSDNHRLVI